MTRDKIIKLRDFLMARLAEKNTNIFMEAHLEELIAVCNVALQSPAAPTVPLPFTANPVSDYMRGYKEGWNDCRAKALEPQRDAG